MRLWIPSLCLLILTAACDASGIHALGRRRDALVPCEVDLLGRAETTSTWVRSTPEGRVLAPRGAACTEKSSKRRPKSAWGAIYRRRADTTPTTGPCASGRIGAMRNR